MLTGRVLRILGFALAAVAAACGRNEEASPHARVACVGCHRQGVDADSLLDVPDRSCTASGCHTDGGPDSVTVRMVRFAHRAHPSGSGAAAPCAGCHTHRPDSVRLAAGTTACTGCHASDIASRSDTACAMCHGNPMHTRTTSEGLRLPHEELRDANVSCTRCHYRLLDTSGPRPVHRVVAMSSTVRLDCLECHALTHSPRIPADTLPDSTCGDCHRDVHQDAQRMILGVLPGRPAEPSAMFMGGVTCRSCHVVPGQAAPRPGLSRRGSPAACTGCHGGAWNGVLARWNRGYDRRRNLVAAYLTTAREALSDSATPAAPAVRRRLEEAAGLLAFVERAGPLHNLPVTDRLLRRALALGREAYGAAQRDAPAVPQLGPAVVPGTCLSCHYGVEEAIVGLDSTTGRRATHADHVFRAGLTCDNCHAPGAAPPGLIGDSSLFRAGGRDTVRTPRPRR
jgi:hypothetical protein